MAKDNHIWRHGPQAGLDGVGEGAHGISIRASGSGSGAKGSNERSRLGAAAAALLLPAARNQPDSVGMALDQKAAYACRATDLVRADRHHVGCRGGKIQRQLGERLYRVDEEAVARRADKGIYPRHRLDDASFIIDPVQRN